MSDDDLTFLGAATLLAQAVDGVSREASSIDIDHAVTNAEKLRAELEKRRAVRRGQPVYGVLDELQKREAEVRHE